VENDRYKSAVGAGRKLLPRSILGDHPTFRFAEMPRLKRREYGTVQLPAAGEIKRFAQAARLL
jgi:hypothetical protein